MSLDAAVAAIRARAESLWPGIEAAVLLTWPNETTAPDGSLLPPHDANGAQLPFLTVEVKWNTGGFISIGAPGNNLTRREGHIWIYAFIPAGSGEGRAHKLAGEMGGIFEGQDFAGIVCWGMEPGGPVDSEDGAYYGQSAAIPFQFDETA